jgi:predicted dithiol-disulfide oxidoreductase (DUF899 family)
MSSDAGELPDYIPIRQQAGATAAITSSFAALAPAPTTTRALPLGPHSPELGPHQDGETFGLSVFLRDGDSVFRTYFTKARGVEALGSVWTFLDLTPLGGQEEWEGSPAGYPRTKPYGWWRRHDEYEDG